MRVLCDHKEENDSRAKLGEQVGTSERRFEGPLPLLRAKIPQLDIIPFFGFRLRAYRQHSNLCLCHRLLRESISIFSCDSVPLSGS